MLVVENKLKLDKHSFNTYPYFDIPTGFLILFSSVTPVVV